MPTKFLQRRRRAGMPMNNKQASVAPLAAYQGTPLNLGRTKAPVVAAVVDTVKVPVPAAAPVMLTGDVAPKLKVGGSVAPVGLDARTAVRVTVPVKPPLGVTVIVEVLAVVAPGLTVRVPLLVRANVGGGVTVRVANPEMVPAQVRAYVYVPATVGVMTAELPYRFALICPIWSPVHVLPA